jgi:hypothetical protein
MSLGRKERIHYPKNLIFDVKSKHNQLNNKVKEYYLRGQFGLSQLQFLKIICELKM